LGQLHFLRGTATRRDLHLISPALRGGLLALLAAVFGISTPLVQRFAQVSARHDGGPAVRGAAVGALSRRLSRSAPGAPDLPRLGNRRLRGRSTGGAAGTAADQRDEYFADARSLFTSVLAWRLYRESMGSRVDGLLRLGCGAKPRRLSRRPAQLRGLSL
jgi:hypothetical protein